MNQIVPCEWDHVIPDRRPACFSRPSVAVPGSGAELRSLSHCLIGTYRTDADDRLDGAISLSWHPSRGSLDGRMKACSLSPGSRRLVGCSSSGGLGRLCYWSGVVVASLIIPSAFPTLGGADPLPPDCHDRSARELRIAPVYRCALESNGSAACTMARMPLGSRSVHLGCGRIWDRSTAV